MAWPGLMCDAMNYRVGVEDKDWGTMRVVR